MKKINALRMSVALMLLITLPIFLSGCAGLTTILAGLSKIFEGAKMIVDGISAAIGSFGKKSEGNPQEPQSAVDHQPAFSSQTINKGPILDSFSSDNAAQNSGIPGSGN